jgi:hypothetical protein
MTLDVVPELSAAGSVAGIAPRTAHVEAAGLRESASNKFSFQAPNSKMILDNARWMAGQKPASEVILNFEKKLTLQVA